MTLYRPIPSQHIARFDSSRPSDISALQHAHPSEIRQRYLTIIAEQLLEEARPLLGAENHEIVFDFVVNHMLMPPDRAGRDQALELLYDKMKGVTFMGFAQNLGESVELVRLANSLDDHLVAILESRRFASASLVDPSEIDLAMVEEGRSAERRRQVELLCNNLRFFHKLVNTPLSRFVLPSMKSLARAIGVAALVDQIEVGYRAARSIADVEAVCHAITTRANRHYDALYGGAP